MVIRLATRYHLHLTWWGDRSHYTPSQELYKAEVAQARRAEVRSATLLIARQLFSPLTRVKRLDHMSKEDTVKQCLVYLVLSVLLGSLLLFGQTCPTMIERLIGGFFLGMSGVYTAFFAVLRKLQSP